MLSSGAWLVTMTNTMRPDPLMTITTSPSLTIADTLEITTLMELAITISTVILTLTETTTVALTIATLTTQGMSLAQTMRMMRLTICLAEEHQASGDIRHPDLTSHSCNSVACLDPSIVRLMRMTGYLTLMPVWGRL